jgi:hypothetical protein
VRPVSQGIKFGSTQRLETTNLKVIYVPEQLVDQTLSVREEKPNPGAG